MNHLIELTNVKTNEVKLIDNPNSLVLYLIRYFDGRFGGTYKNFSEEGIITEFSLRGQVRRLVLREDQVLFATIRGVDWKITRKEVYTSLDVV